MDILTIMVPRYDAEQRARDVAIMIKRAAAAGRRAVVVLSTAYWPPSHLRPEWLASLAECTVAVANVSGRPPVLADVPPDTFDDLKAGRCPDVLASTDAVLDQLFRDCGRGKKRQLAAIKDELRLISGDLITSRLASLRLLTRGHFELPGGSHHTNVRINFGSLLSKADGVDGLRGYISCVAARTIAPFDPGTLVYPTDIKDRVFSRMVRDIRSNLLRTGVHVEDVRMIGKHSDPQLAPEESSRVNRDRPVVLIEDIEGTGKRMAAARDKLSELKITPTVGVVFLRRSGLKSTTHSENLICLASVDADIFERSECRLQRRVHPIRVEVVDDPQEQRPELGQPRRALFWSSVLLGGRIGAPPERDPRHLHDLFVEPSLDADHLDALMEDVLPELDALGVKLVVYHDTPIAEAMANRVKALRSDPLVPTQAITRGADGRWFLPADFRGHGESVVIFDDGRNRGDAQADIMYEVQRCGYRVVATVILEDKLDERGAFTADAIARRVDAPSHTFSIHRAIAADRTTRETCLAHEVQDAVQLLLRSASRRPAFATEACKALNVHCLWPPDTHSGMNADANGLLKLDANCGMSDQWNQLLFHHRGLAAHTRAMDTIIRDALLELRTSDLGPRLWELDMAWRERALLWLAPRDRIGLPPDVRNPRSCRFSLRLGALIATATVQEFADVIALLLGDIEGDPDLGERRYVDLVLHVLRATLSRQDPAAWLNIVADALTGCSAPALKTFRDDVNILSTELAGRGQRRSKVRAIPSPQGMPIDDPTDEDIESYSREMWVLDVRRREASLTDDGVTTIVDRHDALTVALAIVQHRPAYTPDVTGYFVDAKEQLQLQAQRRFMTTLRRLRRSPLSAIASRGFKPRKNRKEYMLTVTDRPGMLICYEDGNPLMHELAKRLTLV
jgi:hypothetical protein